MKIFVTGASGFVGGAAVAHLGSNHQIIAMSRSEASDEKIRALGVEPVRSSLGSVTVEQLADCDAIIHCAAYVEEWGPYSTYERMNVQGTKQLLDIAKQAGVERFVHISTEASLFYGQHMRNVDESTALATHSPFPYSKTKALAEIAVNEANDPDSGFSTIILRPRLIWGPGDQTVLAVILKMAAANKFAWVDGGKIKTSTTHIHNLVHAIELSLSEGGAGETYFILDGAAVTFHDFMTAYARTAGTDLGERSVPGWVARTLANILEPLWRLVRAKSTPPITRFAAYIMSREGTMTDEKARSKMNYKPVISVEAGLQALSGNQQAF